MNTIPISTYLTRMQLRYSIQSAIYIAHVMFPSQLRSLSNFCVSRRPFCIELSFISTVMATRRAAADRHAEEDPASLTMQLFRKPASVRILG